MIFECLRYRTDRRQYYPEAGSSDAYFLDMIKIYTKEIYTNGSPCKGVSCHLCYRITWFQRAESFSFSFVCLLFQNSMRDPHFLGLVLEN